MMLWGFALNYLWRHSIDTSFFVTTTAKVKLTVKVSEQKIFFRWRVRGRGRESDGKSSSHVQWFNSSDFSSKSCFPSDDAKQKSRKKRNKHLQIDQYQAHVCLWHVQLASGLRKIIIFFVKSWKKQRELLSQPINLRHDLPESWMRRQAARGRRDRFELEGWLRRLSCIFSRMTSQA